MKKLLAEKQGQVAEAFCRDDELAQMDKSLGRGTPQPNSNESVTQQSLNKAEIKPKNSAETKLLNEIDPSSLNDEQKAVFEVLTGQKDKIILQGKNLNDLYILERGTRQRRRKAL